MKGVDILSKWTECNQGHIFQFFNELTPTERSMLIQQASSIDPKLVNQVYTEACQKNNKSSQCLIQIAPFRDVVDLDQVSHDEKAHWEDIGYNLIAEGRVAALLMAGGQGTRLNFDHPKGTYDIGLPSKKSLFELQADRIWRLQKLAAERVKNPKLSCVIPWYIMTSSATECSTKQFFELHNYFGLDKKNIFFFNQGYFPCCFEDGRVMMQSKYQIACAPNGNGGLWEALEPSGVLQDMERRKIRVVSSYCVDNVLAKVADPIFAGFLEDKQCDVSCKVIEKKPEERVGVFCLLNNSPAVIEYSEIDQFDMKPGLLKDVSNTKQSINSLFNIAHIVLNNFSFDFVQRMSKIHQRCPSQFHLAKKCIPHIDSNGKLVADKMGLKFERFVFDVFPLANKLCALKVRRNEEFSPLKNSVEYSFDNSITCRLHLSQLCKEYIKRAGGRFETEDPNALCEISPRVTYSGEGLEQLVSGKTIELPCYIH